MTEGAASPPKLAARVHASIARFRFWIFALLVANFTLVHFFFLGFMSWDGFGHRVPPVVELVQHGSFGLEKYEDWALIAFRPFVELTNAPFLWVFGMEGLFFGFALTLFPFCVWSIFAFAKKVTGDRRAAFYAAAVYVLLPLVNAQLTACYVDWAIPGLLAFFLYALLSAKDAPVGMSSVARLAIATLVFALSRQQAPYLAVFFFGVIGILTLLERRSRREALFRPGDLALGCALALGLAPSAMFQVMNYRQYGSPIFPYGFNMFGLKTPGFNLQEHGQLFGLDEYSPKGLFKATVGSWLVPPRFPYAFFDGRDYGAGLFLVTALFGLPLSLPRANRTTRVLLAAFVLVSYGAKDFWNPRFAVTLMLGLSVCNGLAVARLIELPRRAPLYLAFLGMFALHAMRPEWELYCMTVRGEPYAHMNISGSRWYVEKSFDILLYPDMNASFVIVDGPGNNFILPLFGRRLTNTVLGSVHHDKIGPKCEGLHGWDGTAPNVLVVDDENYTKNCARTCALEHNGHCFAFKIER